MKNSGFYLKMTIIWALGILAWVVCLAYDVHTGEVNPPRVAVCICSIICFVLNLSVYLKLRKKGQ